MYYGEYYSLSLYGKERSHATVAMQHPTGIRESWRWALKQSKSVADTGFQKDYSTNAPSGKDHLNAAFDLSVCLRACVKLT